MRRERMKFLMFSHETDRITRFLFCFRHPNFHVMERFWAVMSRSVWPQHVVWVSTVLLISSKWNATSCLATSCLVKSQHSRCSQSAATVLMTWCGGAPQSGKTITVERPLTMPTCSYLLSKIPDSVRLELFNDNSQQTQTL